MTTTLNTPAAAATSGSTQTTAAIEAHDLVKTFKTKSGVNRAVDGVDLVVQPGTVYGVLGPNGAGKTTTVRMLGTLLRPDSGSARIFGYDVARHPQVVRSLVGLTGQYASVDEDLTAVQNLMVFGRLLGLTRRAARTRTGELLEEFSLTEAADRPLKDFSGGMRRRLDLAASLIATPPLLFLDEPTTGLDPRTRAQMWDTIRDLVAQGTTVLLTTQYLDEADQLADRIAVIDHGRVIADGTADELKSSIGTSTLQLTPIERADATRAAEIIEQILGETSTLSPEAARITAPMRRPDLLADVLLALRAAGIAVDEMNVQKPTLDEVFLTITEDDRRVPGSPDRTGEPADSKNETENQEGDQ